MSQHKDDSLSLPPDAGGSASTTRRTGPAPRISPSDVVAGDLASSPFETPPVPGVAHATAPEPLGLAGRHEVRDRIGKGGMGEVYRGRDPDLGRELALKVLLANPLLHPQAAERFREEAQIAGQLQHPGVVPIHELGRLDDGRPFFTMKLVKGQTLEKLLDERSSPAQDRPRFLKVFEQICQTIAYAHSRGVIHRDLKPGNVMVGAFGEVLVMDWGLAKVLEKVPNEEPLLDLPARQTESVIQVTPTDSVSDTQEGEVLGTPSFMSPEQALGEIDRLDPRCDVFSLGAILCEVLTGQPPYTGPDTMAVLRKARRGELSDALARLDGCGADAELTALVKRCLTPERDVRPRDGGAVAQGIENYLARVEERARQAETERAAAQAREEEATATAAAERRARRLTLGLGVSVLLLVLAGGGSAWVIQRHQAEVEVRRQRAEDRAQGMIEQARAMLPDAWERADARRLDECLTLAQRADEILRDGESSDGVRSEARQLLKEVEAKRVQTVKNRDLLAALLDVRQPRETDSYRTDESGRAVLLAEIPLEEQYSLAFRRWGVEVDGVPLEELVRILEEQPRLVRNEIVSGLDEWLRERRRSGKPEARRRLHELADRLDADASRRELRRLRESGALRQDRARLRQLAQQLKPAAEQVLGVVALASTLSEAGEVALAEEMLRSALVARPSEVVLLNQLGQLLEQQRPPRWAEAAECYRASRAARPELGVALSRALMELRRPAEAEAILTRLTESQPHNPDLLFDFAKVQFAQKKWEQAASSSRKAIELQPDFAAAYNNLGIVLRAQKKGEAAVAAYGKALELQPDFAAAYTNLGAILLEQLKPKDAEAAFRKAIALRPDLVEAYHNLAIVLHAEKKPEEAETACRKAIALRPDYAEAYHNLGNALFAQEKPDQAAASYRKAIELKPDFAESYFNLGNVLHAQRKLEEAEAALRKAIALQPDLAFAHNNLGITLHARKKPAEAVTAYRKVIALRPDFAEGYSNLGHALLDVQQPKEAEAVCRKAIELKPDFPFAHNNLGLALDRQKKTEAAVAAYRKAIELKPDYATAYLNLGVALYAQQKVEEAVTACRKAIELQPDYGKAYLHLGNVLSAQKKWSEAAAAFRKASELGPEYAAAYYNLGNVLRAQVKLDEAAAAYRKAIELDSEDAESYSNLGVILLAQRKPEEAAAAFRKAIALQPNLAAAHTNLGNALLALQQLDKAVASYRQALALNPRDAATYFNLGNALTAQRNLAEAETAYRQAIALRPDHAEAYLNLANALFARKKPDEAVASYRKAIELKPDYAEAYNNLANVLREQKKLAEAAAALRKADQLLPNNPVIRTNLRSTERWLELERKLPALLEGKVKPRDAQEMLELASFCHSYKQFYRSACTFYRDAFQLDPQRADDLDEQHRYNAACAAALAASGKGAEANRIEEKERATLRKQASDWLRADLDEYRKLMEKPAPALKQAVGQTLTRWRADADLAGLREEKALAALPEVERALWQKLWADVARLMTESERKD